MKKNGFTVANITGYVANFSTNGFYKGNMVAKNG
jgi:hypothetical protein